MRSTQLESLTFMNVQ